MENWFIKFSLCVCVCGGAGVVMGRDRFKNSTVRGSG